MEFTACCSRSSRWRCCRCAWWPVRIPRHQIVNAEIGPLKSWAWLRLWGTGGWFGSYGLFWKPGTGLVRLYATKTTQGVHLERSHGLPLLVTPDDPEALTTLLRQSLRRPLHPPLHR